MISADEALDRLREGNRRFVEGVRDGDERRDAARRQALAQGQEPFAIVLGCSDSRVTPEIVFEQGLGDLFVIRVAGNIAAPTLVGSIELALELCGVPLIVVLGHSMCGAVLATLDQLERPRASLSPDLHEIFDRIRPSVEPLLKTEPRPVREALVQSAIRANIRASASRLRNGSRVIEQRMDSQGLLVVSAEYSLETGVVEFFAGLPGGS